MTAGDLQLQLDVLAEVLREDSGVLTLQALAGRVLANPRSLIGGVALARALRVLDDEGLVFSDGVFVRPSRPALHVKHLLNLGPDVDLGSTVCERCETIWRNRSR